MTDSDDSPRQYPRYQLNAYVDVTSSKNVLLYHQIQNLSLGGICIQTQTMHDIGQKVDVVINFPELGKEVALLGEVVWANNEAPEDVGIRWLALDDERRELLRKYIAMVDAS